MMSQKDAVYSAVTNVCSASDTHADMYEPSTEERAQINAILFEGIRAGKIKMDVEKTDADMKGYCSGLLSNWLRKDKRLNGGVKYEAKNPGSRTGSTDPQLKALRALLTTDLSVEDKAEVQGYITARTAEISATKQAKVVDFSALPADLQAKFAK